MVYGKGGTDMSRHSLFPPKLKAAMVLLYAIWRAMPVRASAAVAIPLMLGVLLVPGLAAQKALVDLFVHDIGAIDRSAWLALAWPPLAVFAGAAVLRVALTAWHNVADQRLRDLASQHLQAEVHKRAVQVSLERMEQADYYDRLQRAEWAAASDLFAIMQNVGGFLRLMFELVGLLAAAALAHPALGALLLVLFGASLAIRLEADVTVRRVNRDITRSGRQSDYLRDVLTDSSAIKELRIFGAADYVLGQWAERMRHSLKQRMDARRREIRRGMIISSLQIAGLFGAIAWMAWQLKSGLFTAGAFVVVVQAMRQAYDISAKMAHPLSKIYIQGAQIEDLVEFLQEQPESELAAPMPSDERPVAAAQAAGRSSRAQLPGRQGRIAFERVSYRYEGASAPALCDIRLTLNPGETVALVGENGAGKSTLVKLLLGLYRPTSGRITWDGEDYADLDLGGLRSAMSAVFQDFVRYETTLRDNVAFGRPDRAHTDESVCRALQACGMAGLAAGPDGLDAGLGQQAAGSRELSGGQWQRLAIARAAIRDARLLVLDEPTAALDPLHEAELYRSFRELAQGRTVLFVSHRLGWARWADRIVVLENGRIAEEGEHDALLAADGVYARMFRSQAEWYRGA